VSTNSSRSIFLDPKDLLAASLRGNAGIDLGRVSHMSGSKSVLSGSRFKRSGGVCLSPTYTGDWLFGKLRHLVILSNSIKPWPMTDTKLVRTLAGHLEMQKVVIMGDLRLPEFDKNRRINH
jgi:hypothetical protein